MELEDGVVVHVVEELLRPQNKAEDDFPRLEILAGAGYYARINERMAATGASSLCTPRSLRSISSGSTASGIPPMPVCSTAPSSISPATLRAIAACISVISGFFMAHSGRDDSTTASSLLTWMKLSP